MTSQLGRDQHTLLEENRDLEPGLQEIDFTPRLESKDYRRNPVRVPVLPRMWCYDYFSIKPEDLW
jgi:hypothetical protein